ncbi:MAG: platelet-activating factor acetylhydrolase IB subunit [Gemmataceae bacterium]|nr:platelet-activating factor acetylhydrolase IB subunit [Gemmataceae bacterium]MDW8266031.1 platelet-activating factor acetylhydrolase IB subunit [Gemmataceae bacterium]
MRVRQPLLTGWMLIVGLVVLAPLGRADDQKENTAIKPVPRDEKWMKRHALFLERAKKGDVDVLFLGDSITQGWEGNGKEVWKEHFEPLKAVNFGIGGDRTQHVLWRITEGKELEGIQPKVAVLMIGTNNLSNNTNEEIAEGVTAIVKELGRQRPQTKVLLLGIFPRGAKPDDKNRERIKAINAMLAKLDDGKQIRFLDIGAKFLDADGNLSKEIMYDFLHLTPKGYQIWAEAIKPVLLEMLRG